MAAAVKLGQGEPGRAWPRRKCLGAGGARPGGLLWMEGPWGPAGVRRDRWALHVWMGAL